MAAEQTAAEQTILAQLAQQVKQAGGVPNLAKAFVAAYAEIDNVVKNAANPHFGSNYADLGAVLDTIRPVFSRHRLALAQGGGEISGDKMRLTNLLIHESGEMLSFPLDMPIGKATAQAVGSAMTYGRRYQAAAIAGIAQVDDDGNAASEAPKAKAGPAKAAVRAEAQAVGGLMEAIAGATTVEALEALKEDVKAAKETVLSEAYLARKKALKEGK